MKKDSVRLYFTKWEIGW